MKFKSMMHRTLNASSWVSSSLGLNLALELCNKKTPTLEKYKQINDFIKLKRENKVISKLFLSKIASSAFGCASDIHKNLVNFEDNSATTIINNWITENVNELHLNRSFPNDITTLMANVHSFRDTWQINEKGLPLMKVYNSFNYTQDIKYESRLMELPTVGDFKLVVIVPNESDVLDNVFAKLATEGLGAAVRCIQPLFTVSTHLVAPCINVDSEILTQHDERTVLRRGKMKVDDQGLNISVLTCIYNTKKKEKTSKKDKTISREESFYFGLTFKDISLFNGKYCP